MRRRRNRPTDSSAFTETRVSLEELVEAIQDQGATEAEELAVLTHLLAHPRARLHGQRVRLTQRGALRA